MIGVAVTALIVVAVVVLIMVAGGVALGIAIVRRLRDWEGTAPAHEVKRSKQRGVY